MGGGDVLVFHASAPNAGVGSLGPMKSSGVGGSASGAATPALSRGHASSSQSIGAATPAAPTRAADFAAGGGQAPPAGFPASKAGLPLCHKGIPQLPLGGATPIGGRTPGAMSFAGASPGGVSTASKAAGPDCFGAGPPAAASPQQAAFYEEELKRCTRAGVAVSCVTAPAASEDALDVGALQWLPWRTGGETMHFPCFGPEQGRWPERVRVCCVWAQLHEGRCAWVQVFHAHVRKYARWFHGVFLPLTKATLGGQPGALDGEDAGPTILQREPRESPCTRSVAAPLFATTQQPKLSMFKRWPLIIRCSCHMTSLH